MKRSEFDSLSSIEESKNLISVGELSSITDRTLLWGYTCGQESFHVYLKDKAIFLAVYNGGFGRVPLQIITGLKGYSLECKLLIPDKRLYPEACDYEFCSLLIQKGCYLPFTAWTPERKEDIYYGEIFPSNAKFSEEGVWLPTTP